MCEFANIQNKLTIYKFFMVIFALKLIIRRRNMIEYIKGELAEATPALAVVDCNGVGYGINVSLNTYSAIQGKKEVKLFIYEAIREDAYVLYGFSTKQERELFLLLISVTGNDKLLKTVKGIGLKTAQRIIVDLKDKIASTDLEETGTVASVRITVNSEIYEEAVAALVMLGFAQAPSQKAVINILKAEPDATVEQVIKLALKML